MTLTVASLDQPQPGKLFRHVFYPLQPQPAVPSEEPVTRQALTVFDTADQYMAVHFWGRSNSAHSIGITCDAHPANPEEQEKRRVQCLNHALTMVRSMHNPAMELVKTNGMFAVAVVENDILASNYNPICSASSHTATSSQFTYGQLNTMFGLTLNTLLRPLMALRAESLHPSIPLHYRVLSLTRALELLDPGDDRARRLRVNAYQDEWLALGLGEGQFYGNLERIRARCAHGWPRGGGDTYIGSAVDEEPKLAALGLLLTKILHSAMNSLAPDGLKFAMQDSQGRMI